jgi:hypothetical protein
LKLNVAFTGDSSGVFVHLDATLLALESARTLARSNVGVGGDLIPADVPGGVGDFATLPGNGEFVFEWVFPA